MILIYAKNGKHFVNEDEVRNVLVDLDKKTVRVLDKDSYISERPDYTEVGEVVFMPGLNE